MFSTCPANPATKCKFCNENFNSRNEMFKHLKSSRLCFNLANEGNVDNTRNFLKVEKNKVAIQFGYYTSNGSDRKINEDAADIVCSSFLEAMKYLYPSSLLEYNGNFSLASSVRSRHPVLAQEGECSALTDVIGINYKCVDIKINFEEVLEYVQSILQCKKTDMHIWVLNIKSLAVCTKFHAETSCTQRSYQYVLPVSWIDDDDKDTTNWIKSKIEVDPIVSATQQPNETPSSIMRLKKTLRLLESGDVNEKISKRFGKLANKERKAMHNFCDQSLPMVNPSNEHVWTSIDKARLNGFVIDYSDNDDDNAYIILDFKGDGFLREQCRRMVAAIVAVVRGWLPDDYFDFATDSNFSIETPLAPLHLLYLHSVRFHFLELVIGSKIFEEKRSHAEYLSRLQKRSFLQRRKEYQEEGIWLDDLKSEISIRILACLNEIRSTREDQLKQWGQESNRTIDSANKFQNISISVPLESTPQMYAKALLLLQKVCKQNLWPMTHHSKSIVMKSPFIHDLPKAKTVEKKLNGTHYCGHLLQSGSFTLCNPKLSGSSILPMNQKFPELAQAVFELEKYITTDNDFLASSHCIVSRNVEMTPQFLKGEGNRDTCRIVGLGDYHQGEFVVDGEMHDIRYEPLKFNFWQLYYNKPFRGEKFTLLWYTPKFRNEVRSTSDERFEDSLALSLLKNHSESLPTFPMLRFRRNSTDALVISEILETRSVYTLSPQVWQCMNVSDTTLQVKQEPQQQSLGFGVTSHDVVLDVGAHIGVFCRYALSLGCSNIYAYEPDVQNFSILQQNLTSLNHQPLKIEVHNYAINNDEPGTRKFVHARNRGDGTQNTWRHSLQEHSQYVKREGDELSISNVQTLPFFGASGILQSGITFVKMDIEGAEIDILLSKEASFASNWRDVTQFVFEWSFTKERRVNKFHEAVRNLNIAGFTVCYKGKGAWWDTEKNVLWPYDIDLVVFAKKN